jgi:hypothetical protein
MRTLAWILGIAALAASLFVGTSWTIVSHGEAKARTAVAKLRGNLGDWQTASRLKDEEIRENVRSDQLDIQNDDLTIDIARLEGRSTVPAVLKRSLDTSRLRADELQKESHESTRALGPDINVIYAQERVEAAEQSLAVYKGVAGRDAQMAYAVGVLWLSFGFAFALSGRRSEQP